VLWKLSTDAWLQLPNVIDRDRREAPPPGRLQRNPWDFETDPGHKRSWREDPWETPQWKSYWSEGSDPAVKAKKSRRSDWEGSESRYPGQVAPGLDRISQVGGTVGRVEVEILIRNMRELRGIKGHAPHRSTNSRTHG
jgi:hypothetical protein